MPTLRRLQARHMPLILAKDVYVGFSLDEYREILDALSRRSERASEGDSVEKGAR